MGRYKDFLMESADRPQSKDSLLKSLMNIVGEDYAESVSETSDSDDEEEEFCYYSPELLWDESYEAHASNYTEEYQEPAKEPPEEPAEEEATEEPAGDQEETQARCSALEELLKGHESPECVNKALLKFTERGLHEEVKVLLKYGADPNYIGCTDRLTDDSPLHEAVYRRDPKMVAILMLGGASASQSGGESNEIPLEIACMSKDLRCVRALLEHGADANAEDSLGMTLLMRLVEEKDSLDILELLLEKGADPNLRMGNYFHMESVLCEFFQDFLRSSEAEPVHIDYGLKALHLLLRHGFRIQCCGEFNVNESLLEMSLEDFDRLFPLAQIVSEQVTPCGPDDHCYPRFETLQYRLTEMLRCSSEAAVRPLVDKANKLLDLLIEWPVMKRFTLSPLQDGHRGAEWAVDTVPASLQVLSLAFVRRALLPRPLEAKIEVLPIPKLIQDLLKPVKLD